LDTSDLLPDAVAAGVLFSPGAQFYPDGRASGGLRLTYAMADCRAIRAGVASLGRVVNARLADEPRAARLHM
jgi:2-aminoadipate transaminase